MATGAGATPRSTGDVGGTFTDFVFVNPSDGKVTAGKVLTTPAEPSEAILSGIQDFVAASGKDFSSAHQIVHGTTLGINALLERKGGRTGLLVTEGFRDILDIRRCARVDMYDLGGDFPPPLIARQDRREVKERMSGECIVITKLDEDHVRSQVRALLSENVESIAVCTLHFRNIRLAAAMRHDAVQPLPCVVHPGEALSNPPANSWPLSSW